MKMTFGQIEAFYWTARLGSVRACSEHLHIAQPSVTLRIKEFEQILGVRLFEKAGRGVRLTQHGASLKRHAEHIIALGKDVENYGRSRADQGPKLIRIGAADIFAITCLTKLIKVLEKTHPNLTVEVSVAFSYIVADMLQQGRLDVAFLTNTPPADGFEATFLGCVPVTWMAAPELGLGSRTVRQVDLVHFPVITNPSPSYLYQSIHDWFALEKIWPARVSTCNNLSVIAQLVSGGLGITVLPASMQQFDPFARSLQSLSATPEIPSHRLFAICRQGGPLEESREVIAEAADLVRTSGLFPPA